MHALVAQPTVFGVLHLLVISVIMVTILLMIVALFVLKIVCLVLLLRSVTNVAKDTMSFQTNAMPVNLDVFIALLRSVIKENNFFRNNVQSSSRIVTHAMVPDAYSVMIIIIYMRIVVSLAKIQIV